MGAGPGGARPRGWSRSPTRWPGDGIDVVAADPEVPAADDRRSATRSRRPASAPIEEIQPSRHRMSLPLGRAWTRTAVFDGVAKSTRQRIRGAETRRGRRRPSRRAGRTGRAWGRVRRPDRAAEVALDRFYDLLLETGERRHFAFGPRGRVRRLVARRARGRPPRLPRGAGDGAAASPLAGLILYRHGGRLSTVHSGDHAGGRARRTRARSTSCAGGRSSSRSARAATEMDLGGVDVAGARGEPARASRCTACTSTSARSAGGGSS